ncbi:MAG: D-alanyl-D-alanine carboxypeptidase [Bacillota bacterium]|nr:MAG: D-alanyl-D-alanine carboxypeptidase [Bacillota bacterium]
MFIPTRQLRAWGAALLAAVAALLVLQLIAEPMVNRSVPVWMAVEPGPPLVYADGYEQGPPGPPLRAAAAILIEANTGTVLYAHNEHERRPMASTTKIMTALMALETTPLEQLVTVSPQAVRVTGSDAGLRPGQRLTMFELLHALMLPSGNDAANVVAEHVAGSQAAFAQLMTERARELGAVRTRFANAHGLDDPNHYSTAHDLALLSMVAMRLPTFSQVVRTPHFQAQSISASWRNTNRLLWSFEGIEGVKTGTTGGAGYCLVAAASRDGMRLISVVLGSPDRWNDSVRLLEYGFDQFHLITLAAHGEVLAEARVPGGMGTLQAVVDGDFRVVVRDEEINDLQVRVWLERLRAPVRAGETVGALDIMGADGRLIRSVPLLAKETVPRWTVHGALWRWFQELWSSRTGR